MKIRYITWKCDRCSTELTSPEDEIPKGWEQLNFAAYKHLCPSCSDIYRELHEQMAKMDDDFWGVKA